MWLVTGEIESEWKASIERGMKFLDNYFMSQDWVERIDLKELRLNDVKTCVCGQLFATQAEQAYQEGALKRSEAGYDWALMFVVEHDVPEEWARENGFFLPMIEDLDDDDYEKMIEEVNALNSIPDGRKINFWEAFTERWEEAIKARQEELREARSM